MSAAGSIMEIAPCEDAACLTCARPIPTKEPRTPCGYQFACSWSVPLGRHRFVLSRATPHALHQASLTWGAGGWLRLMRVAVAGREWLGGPTSLWPTGGSLAIPFAGLGLDPEHPITFALENDGPLAVRLAVAFMVERRS